MAVSVRSTGLVLDNECIGYALNKLYTFFAKTQEIKFKNK